MLRLKEKPIEWVKFTAVIAVVVNVVLWLLARHGAVPRAVPVVVTGIGTLAVVAAAIRPAWFRGFYRRGMTISFHIGQTIGKVLLVLLFLLFVTPLGLVLRLCGKDPLELKPPTDRDSYWHTSKNDREFDRMY